MIQRFSIAKLFLLITLAAVGSLTVRQAFMGADWAKAVSLVVFAALLWVAIHMLLGLLGYAFMEIAQSLTPDKGQSPFATDVPAPQIIPPKNIESD
ncbi:hypothetical protein Pan97_31930 [Bremerella volcania]|uniref:Uncharacterized protein n=1 Tax=Bremerella volcania TaxID=2527984 RepID=A0A518CA89_9BACT|nr:hypothetical protein [Bremerella volcania]QDU76148.1 hypothetical protein Pan97_31930 [Bremerella volcania]